MLTINQLINVLPQQGQVEWIGLRPAKNEPMQSVSTATAIAGQGLAGDRYRSTGGKRQVTLIQAEHVEALRGMLHFPDLAPDILRRNIVVRGINLLALKDKEFRVGDVTMRFTGLCHPCSKMELALGPGGYNAMRGHGGINATILNDGMITIGDVVAAADPTN
ncbi:MAG: MOSC domain-containing protein [bacterium]